MTLKSLSDDELHEKLIRLFMEYSKWNTRFDLFGYKESAVKARVALMDISKVAREKRRRIQAKKEELYDNQNEGDDEDDDDT